MVGAEERVMKSYYRTQSQFLFVQQKINRMKMDLRVRILSPRAKKMLEERIALLRNTLR